VEASIQIGFNNPALLLLCPRNCADRLKMLTYWWENHNISSHLKHTLSLWLQLTNTI